MNEHQMAVEAYGQAEKSWIAKPLGFRRRSVILAVAFDEARRLKESYPDISTDEARQRLKRNLLIRYKQNPLVGFPWVTLAMILADIVVKLVLAWWEKRQ